MEPVTTMAASNGSFRSVLPTDNEKVSIVRMRELLRVYLWRMKNMKNIEREKVDLKM